MPLLSIDTNIAMDSAEAKDFIQSASKVVAEMLSKPERYVMVKLENNPHMLFDGNDEPLVYAELKSLGLPETQTKEFSAQLMEFLSTKTGVAADRVYIEFANAERHMWGWNASTF